MPQLTKSQKRRLCTNCRFCDCESDFPNIWCDKYERMLNGMSREDIESFCEVTP